MGLPTIAVVFFARATNIMNLYFSLRIVFFEFNLRLVFLAHINLRLDAGATDNGGRSKLSVQGIFCFVQLFRFLTSLIREQGELGDFLTGDIGKCNAQQPKRCSAVPQLIKQLLADLIDLLGDVC